MSTSITQQGTDFCTTTAANWMMKLAACINTVNSLPLSDPTNTALPIYNLIKNGLIDVCSRGVDVNNPFGASLGVPTSGSTPPTSIASFQGILNNYLGIVEANKATCNAMLISFPPEYNHSFTSGATNSQTLDKCACDKIFQNELIYTVFNTLVQLLGGQPLPFTEVDFYNQNNIASANFVTPALYNKLKCKCKDVIGLTPTTIVNPLPHVWTSGELSTLAGLGNDYTIIGDMGCPSCHNCADIAAAITSFTAAPSSYSNIPVSSANFQTSLTNYLNQQLNFNLLWDDI
jgi:hypothetical protein